MRLADGQWRPCSRWGRDAPIFRLRLEDVRRTGWTPYVAAAYVNWCGQGQEIIPVPNGAQQPGVSHPAPL